MSDDVFKPITIALKAMRQTKETSQKGLSEAQKRIRNLQIEIEAREEQNRNAYILIADNTAWIDAARMEMEEQRTLAAEYQRDLLELQNQLEQIQNQQK